MTMERYIIPSDDGPVQEPLTEQERADLDAWCESIRLGRPTPELLAYMERIERQEDAS